MRPNHRCVEQNRFEREAIKVKTGATVLLETSALEPGRYGFVSEYHAHTAKDRLPSCSAPS